MHQVAAASNRRKISCRIFYGIGRCTTSAVAGLPCRRPNRFLLGGGAGLGYAQSVVSHHVAALEREFGLSLINRGTRPVSVTDAGGRLLIYSETALGYISAAEDELRAVAGLESGTLRIGAFLTAANSFPAAVARFEAAHPDVEVRLVHLEEPEELRRLRSGDIDLAVVYRVREPLESRRRRRDEGLTKPLAEDPYRVVLPPTHPLGRRRRLRLADLADERFTAPPGGGFFPAARCSNSSAPTPASCRTSSTR